MPRLRFRPLALLIVLTTVSALTACTTQVVQERPDSDLMAVAPALSVERFLQAVNAQDYQAMARLFGTVRGPIEGDRREIEVRMATIAEILRHRNYEIGSERRPPGRESETRRVGVDLTIGNRLIRDVGFMVVQTEEGGWLVEEIDLEKVTSY
ncbi:MAG: hypothetical protein P8188_18665 [Gemmatimonadota bacterium]|jgi:hypothetical protein